MRHFFWLIAWQSANRVIEPRPEARQYFCARLRHPAITWYQPGVPLITKAINNHAAKKSRGPQFDATVVYLPGDNRTNNRFLLLL